MTPEERSSINNAIWLCRICARLIDVDEIAFPGELLAEWKRKAERLASAEIGRPHEPTGLLPEIITDIKHAVLGALAESGAKAQEWADKELESAVENIKAYRYEGARTLLQHLQDSRWQDLTDRQKFRVLTNLGSIFLAERNNGRAAECFREAKTYQPDDQKSWENEALAHQILGEKTEAVSLAAKIRDRWPESVRALGIILSELPAETPAEKIRKQIPEKLLTDPEICMVVSQRASMLRDFATAEDFAGRAVSGLPDRSFAQFLLGQAILASTIADNWQKHARIAVGQNSERLSEAENHLNLAVASAKREKAFDIASQALVIRASLHEIRNEKKECELDVDEAYHICPSHPPALAAYANLISSRGNIDDAIAIMRKALASDDSEEGRFLLAGFLRERGSRDDLKEALDIQCVLAITRRQVVDGFREHVASSAMFIAREINDFEEVDKLVDKIPNESISQTAKDILRIRLAIAHGQQDQANELANQAVKNIPENAKAHDYRNLALVLCQLSRFQDALPFWQKIAPSDCFTADTKYLLDCAMRAEQHGVALDLCKTLRAKGVDDAELFDAEMFVLERYAPNEALERIGEEVEKHPDDRLLSLRRSIIALRLDRPDLATAAPDKLPTSSEVSPRDALFAIAIIRSVGDPNDGVRYAYEVLRRHFGSIDAHRAYLSSMNPGEHDPTIPVSVDAVSTGCAVRFVVEGSTDEQWTVIEDAPEPDPARKEISPSSTLAMQLLGKRAGESFEISKFSRATVQEITSKFVYRYQDCIQQWQFRFSDEADFLSFQLGKTGTFETDFAPLLAATRARRERTEEIENIYSAQTVPIHVIAEALHVDDFVALAGLANGPEVLIRCCEGSAAERETAVNALSQNPAVIVDITAIGTLILLDQVDLLKVLPFPIIVSSGTLAILEHMLREETKDLAHRVGFIQDVGGKLQFKETTEEYKARRSEELRQLVEIVKTRCDVRSCSQLAYLPPERRNQILELFGQHGAESILLASKPGTVIWTDDITVAGVAREFANVPRVWTHLVLQYLNKMGVIDGDAYVEAAAKLAGWGYFFTSITADAVLVSGRLADWNPEKWPLKQNLHYLTVETVPPQEIRNLVVDLIVKLYRRRLPPHKQNSTMVAILDKLAGSRGTEFVLAIRRLLPTAFSIDVVGAIDAQNTIDAWLATKSRRL